MKSVLEVLLDDLLALKSEGIGRVVASDEALLALKNALSETAKDVPAGTPNYAEALMNSAKAANSGNENSAGTPKSSEKKSEKTFPKPPKIEIKSAGTKAEKMAEIHAQILADPGCRANLKPGAKLVFGAGNFDSPVVFLGEAPGSEEESAGTPFVGVAGEHLTKIILATGLSRERVFVENLVKWRLAADSAHGNRAPTSAEMAYCLPFFEAEISVIAPKVIVSLGLAATSALLGEAISSRKMSEIRGKEFEFRGVPVIPTFHPSYLLRNNTLKSKRLVWEDFMEMMKKISLPISEKQKRFFLPKA